VKTYREGEPVTYTDMNRLLGDEVEAVTLTFRRPGKYLVDVDEHEVHIYQNSGDAVPIGHTDEITTDQLVPNDVWTVVSE